MAVTVKMSARMWRRVIYDKFTDISEKCPHPIFREHEWRWRLLFTPKYLQISTELHGVIFFGITTFSPLLPSLYYPFWICEDTAFCWKETWNFPGDKKAWAWSWPLTSSYTSTNKTVVMGLSSLKQILVFAFVTLLQPTWGFRCFTVTLNERFKRRK